MTGSFGWLSIFRLGIVNAALGATVAFATFTLNRVMTVDLALPAIVPGALIGVHYAVQLVRPRLGFGSDVSGRRTPWIVAGLGALCIGVMLSACAVRIMLHHPSVGVCLAVAGFAIVGAGVSSTGTSSLAMMAVHVAPAKRAAAATIFWMLMIVGAIVSAIASSILLHPFSPAILVRTGCVIGGCAFAVGTACVWGLEGEAVSPRTPDNVSFAATLRAIWHETLARRFAIFIFVSMLAYSAQELILEPFVGRVFGMSPSGSAGLTGLHQGGILLGMVLVAVAGTVAGEGRAFVMRWCTIGGCLASSLCLAALSLSGLVGPGWPLGANVFLLGIGNGAFAVSAIAAMLGLAGQGRPTSEGARMGVWGAAQAVAMGLGGLAGSGASDVARATFGSPAHAYAAVFAAQAALFLFAARVGARLFDAGAHAGSGRPNAANTSNTAASNGIWA